MYKKTVSGIMMTLLFIGIFSLAISIKPTKSTRTGTVYIRADGSIDPPDAPIITYDNITYTLIDNITSSGDGIVIERDNIVINGAGYTIQGNKESLCVGIRLLGRSNITIKNIEINNFTYGIYIESCSNHDIITNIVNGSAAGIYLKSSSYNNIHGNKIYKSGTGIVASDSLNNNITENDLAINSAGICLDSSKNFIVKNNNIVGCSGYGISLLGTESYGNIILGNNITNNERGIYLNCAPGNIISANNIANNIYGMYFYYHYTYANIVSRNYITKNSFGVYLVRAEYNDFFHNNFIDNLWQVYSVISTNCWEYGYPSGGNYWSDYTGVDLFSGPYQNETGSDGIGDSPYVIDEDNVDRYPLMNPWPPIINATVDVKPDTLNLRSMPELITAHIELRQRYNVSHIDVTTILLDSTIPIDFDAPVLVGDYNNNTVPDLTIHFNCTKVAEFIFLKGITYGNITLEVSGRLYDGAIFTGIDVVLVSSLLGDVNVDGKVDIKDIAITAEAFGSFPGHQRWNPQADINRDNKIDITDIALVCGNFGKQA